MELLLLILVLAAVLYGIYKLHSQQVAPYERLQQLHNALEAVQKQAQNQEALLRTELRLQREEASALARENRQELAAALNELTRNMGERLEQLTQRTELHHAANRAAQTTVIKDFTAEQRQLLEALKTELRTANERNLQQADQLALRLEQRLMVMGQALQIDNRQGRGDLERALAQFQEAFERNVQSFNALQRDKFALLETRQQEQLQHTAAQLDAIRSTVAEKLEKTLNERLGQSFETVGKQLLEVQRGLGEMQTLAQDVGGLKRVLSNVKMRGSLGEVQLAMLLEQILAPDQYAANVKTKSNSADLVEFAIRLPGRDDNNGQVWLPIDAKFPKDVYEQLQIAYDQGETSRIEAAQRQLESTIRKMARDIADKYLDPPQTTDFGILFLPFEGIYAEVVRKASFLEELQRQHKIVITGPSTLAAMLNSLQMGFRTLAIQKRSSEVWQVLGAVKTEFANFGGMLQKAQKNIQQGMNQLDDVMGKRTRAIQRKLSHVDALDQEHTKALLPDLELDEEVL